MKRYENEELRTWNIRVNRNVYYVPDNRSAGANEGRAKELEMKEKLYPFSAKKHIHDLSFRSDRLANDIARFGAKYANSTTVKYMQELKERLDAIICMAAGGVSPIWLTGKEYALAVDSVRWAAEHRR